MHASFQELTEENLNLKRENKALMHQVAPLLLVLSIPDLEFERLEARVWQHPVIYRSVFPSVGFSMSQVAELKDMNESLKVHNLKS